MKSATEFCLTRFFPTATVVSSYCHTYHKRTARIAVIRKKDKLFSDLQYTYIHKISWKSAQNFSSYLDHNPLHTNRQRSVTTIPDVMSGGGNAQRTWLMFNCRASSVSNSRSLSSQEPLACSLSLVPLSVSENVNSSLSSTSASLSSSNSLMFLSGMRCRISRVDLRDSFTRRVVARRGSLRCTDDTVSFTCKCVVSEFR